MDQGTNKIFFALLRSAINGVPLTEGERGEFSPKLLPVLLKLASRHDIAHLLVWGLKQNDLISKETISIENNILKAICRHERLDYEYKNLCAALEKAQIPFLPLKGAVIRRSYPQPWMRTSCDIDILVRREHLDRAISYLSDNLDYAEKGKGVYDVSLFSPMDIHVELHFDLVDEGRAGNPLEILGNVWDNVSLCEGSEYRYEMSDAFYYFYHVAHMAKHFETGGCGIRPFIDLWILDHMDGVDKLARDELLSSSKLLKFAEVSRKLSAVWFGGDEKDSLSEQMEEFLLHGGVYGSSDNRVALNQKKRGGRFGYVLRRMFAPTARLRRYYPILERHPWLMPVMQVRRWFMLLKPDVARMAKREMAANKSLDRGKADEMGVFMNNIGL